MQNAAFAAVGLDWEYVVRDVLPADLESAVREVEYANVTAPYKLDVARLLGSKLPSVNTLVVRGGTVEAFSTDAAVLNGLVFDRPAIIGGGGAAVAFRQAMPEAQIFARRGTWPPDVRSHDLVVNATPARDKVLVELGPGQTLVDLPYPETATAAAARDAGAHVVGGLEVLVAQGAASFELWTGLAAPVAVMRSAVGLPA
jgi:shikimate dehydrogenase